MVNPRRAGWIFKFNSEDNNSPNVRIDAHSLSVNASTSTQLTLPESRNEANTYLLFAFVSFNEQEHYLALIVCTYPPLTYVQELWKVALPVVYYS